MIGFKTIQSQRLAKKYSLAKSFGLATSLPLAKTLGKFKPNIQACKRVLDLTSN